MFKSIDELDPRLVLFLPAGLMLSTAMTAFVIRSLAMLSLPVRLLISFSFLFLIMLAVAPLIAAYREERHNLRMASLQQRQKIYHELTDHLLAALDTYQQYDYLDLDDLAYFLKSSRTQLFVYGSRDAITRLDELLKHARCLSKVPSRPGLKDKAALLEEHIIKVVEAIHKDLEERSWEALLPANLMQVCIEGRSPNKPVLRRFK